MKSFMLFCVTATASLFISGCAATNSLEAVKNRVSFDLNCPSEKVNILVQN